MPTSVLNATVDQTAEVTFGDVVTYTYDERTTDSAMFDGNTFFKITCSDGGLKCRRTHVMNTRITAAIASPPVPFQCNDKCAVNPSQRHDMVTGDGRGVFR